MLITLNMFNFFTFFGALRQPSSAPPILQLTDFKEIRRVSADMSYPNEYFDWNKPGGIQLEYYEKTDTDNLRQIGYIRYYKTTGQVGLFFIFKPEHRGRGLGKQILDKAIAEMRENNCKEVWAVTLKNHSFWSNVYGGAFEYRDPAHPSVTSDGYYMKLF